MRRSSFVSSCAPPPPVPAHEHPHSTLTSECKPVCHSNPHPPHAFAAGWCLCRPLLARGGPPSTPSQHKCPPIPTPLPPRPGSRPRPSCPVNFYEGRWEPGLRGAYRIHASIHCKLHCLHARLHRFHARLHRLQSELLRGLLRSRHPSAQGGWARQGWVRERDGKGCQSWQN
jgi:hypothetical protein